MKVLVTGGSGFIGSNFIHYWHATHPDDTIINVDALTYAANQENVASLADNDFYTFEHVDIADVSGIDAVFARHKPDLVVHFAAETHVDRALGERSQFVITNVVGTQVLLEACLAHNVGHFHHISTDEVFGEVGNGQSYAFTENSQYRPRNPYSAAKAGADHLVRAYNISLGLPVTITNCSNNYGPFHTPEKMIPLAITNLLEGKKVPVYGKGLQSRDWLHVEDHCRAIDAVIASGKLGETYLVGAMSDEVNNLALATRLCELLDADPATSIEFVADRKGHDFKYVVDWSKISNDLGWRPQVDLDAGLAKTVDWFKNNEWWWKPIKARQPEFQRITD
jgi:dTDP-glucose 4,6-dehydratase